MFDLLELIFLMGQDQCPCGTIMNKDALINQLSMHYLEELCNKA
jgi:hypothetical protein